MTLTDGDIAALADRAASTVDLALDIQVAPDAGDDPYRWGQRFWVVHFDGGAGRRASVRLAAEDDEPDAEARLTAAVRQLAGDPPPR